MTTATRGCLIAPPSHLLLWTEPGRALFETLADRLSQPGGSWKSFQRSPVNAWMYPEPARRA